MKKLRLKLDGIKELLTREQMKTINGGYAICEAYCYSSETLSTETVSCGSNCPSDDDFCGPDATITGCNCTYY